MKFRLSAELNVIRRSSLFKNVPLEILERNDIRRCMHVRNVRPFLCLFPFSVRFFFHLPNSSLNATCYDLYFTTLGASPCAFRPYLIRFIVSIHSEIMSTFPRCKLFNGTLPRVCGNFTQGQDIHG